MIASATTVNDVRAFVIVVALEMPGGEAEIEQGRNLNRFEKSHRVQRWLLSFCQFAEVLLSPGEQFLRRLLAIREI